jgi:hypothetical protein
LKIKPNGLVSRPGAEWTARLPCFAKLVRRFYEAAGKNFQLLGSSEVLLEGVPPPASGNSTGGHLILAEPLLHSGLQRCAAHDWNLIIEARQLQTCYTVQPSHQHGCASERTINISRPPCGACLSPIVVSDVPADRAPSLDGTCFTSHDSLDVAWKRVLPR